MDGVTIIKTYGTVMKVGHPFLAFTLLLVGVLLGIYGYMILKRGNLMGGVMMIFGLLVCIASYNLKPTVIEDVKYEVRIDDSVSLSEFYKKYEVISCYNENVYIIRERRSK